jgi:hypothetical protein
MSKLMDSKKNKFLDTKKNFGNKILLKSSRLLEDVFNVWDREKDKLKLSSFLAEKYSLMLSRDQLDALIRKCRKQKKNENII